MELICKNQRTQWSWLLKITCHSTLNRSFTVSARDSYRLSGTKAIITEKFSKNWAYYNNTPAGNKNTIKKIQLSKLQVFFISHHFDQYFLEPPTPGNSPICMTFFQGFILKFFAMIFLSWSFFILHFFKLVLVLGNIRNILNRLGDVQNNVLTV